MLAVWEEVRPAVRRPPWSPDRAPWPAQASRPRPTLAAARPSLPGANTITPLLLHAPPRPAGASQIVTAGPPATSIFLSLPLREEADGPAVGRPERQRCAFGRRKTLRLERIERPHVERTDTARQSSSPASTTRVPSGETIGTLVSADAVRRRDGEARHAAAPAAASRVDAAAREGRARRRRPPRQRRRSTPSVRAARLAVAPAASTAATSVSRLAPSSTNSAVGDVADARFGILLQAPLQQRAHRRGHVRAAARPSPAPAHDGAEHVGRRPRRRTRASRSASRTARRRRPRCRRACPRPCRAPARAPCRPPCRESSPRLRHRRAW